MGEVAGRIGDGESVGIGPGDHEVGEKNPLDAVLLLLLVVVDDVVVDGVVVVVGIGDVGVVIVVAVVC